MDILVVEDNQALGEALRRALTDAGHTVRIEDDAEAAIESILGREHDLVIFDAGIDAGSGMDAVDRMGDVREGTDIILLRGFGEGAPPDSKLVKASLTKPFLTEELLEAVDQRSSAAPPARPVPSAKAGRRRPPGRRAHDTASLTAADDTLIFGRSYILFGDSPREIYGAAARLGAEGCGLLIVTTGRGKAVTERFRDRDAEVAALSVGVFDEFSSVYGLGTLLNRIIDFIGRTDKPVVAIDNLDAIISKNGINQALLLIDGIMSADRGRPFTLLVSADARRLSDKDKRILTNDLEPYVPGRPGAREAVE